MASRIVIQAGHCHRTTGSTGTRSADGYTEQQFTWAVANKAADLLRADGHQAVVIGADPTSDTVYRGDAFVAVHADGNNSPNVGGASVGYRTNEGEALAKAWKSAYKALGWSFGFRADNYTAALSGYYGTKRAVAQGNRRACIIEAGFLTNRAEVSQLRTDTGQDRCAQAIRRAVNGVLGHDSPAPPPAVKPKEIDVQPNVLVVLTYNACLGRNPSMQEIAAGVDAIDAIGQLAYVESIANSDEAKAHRAA